MQLREKSYAVPNLVGVDVDVARNQIAGRDWNIVVEKQRDDVQEPGHIIRTDPAEGVMLKEGSSITFVVSEGPTLSKLPDVTGQTIGEATSTLDANKLDIIVADEVYDESAPADTVISWKVPAQPGLGAGMEVMQHTVVAVTVSKGPEPRQVPQLIGLDPAAAQAAMDALQLVLVRDPADVFSNDYPAGIVADQSLPAGTEIQRGESVTIAVSQGQDLVAVPPLAGLTYDQTVAALTGAGLTVGDVEGNKTTGLLYDARVNGDQLKAGQQLLRGTAVDVFYF
jgi:serine/threonine-protein kinase